MPEEATPHYADTVLVPVANPATAASLIELALAIAYGLVTTALAIAAMTYVKLFV